MRQTDNLGEYGNRSVVTGFTLLRALVALGRASSLKEIAVRAQMTPSRVHRFLAGLQQVGAVVQDARSGRYDLGPALIELGVSARLRVDAIKLAIETIEELADATGLVSLLMTWGSNGPTVIKWVRARRLNEITVPEGVNLPLLSTASGNVFLTFGAPEQLKRLLDAEIEALPPAARATIDKRIERIRATVRKNGVASSAGKRVSHLVKLAAPVYEWDGELSLVLTLIGDVNVVDMGETSPVAERLKAAAADLSRKNGYSGVANEDREGMRAGSRR